MTKPQTGSIGEKEAGREARVLGAVAKRTVESYLTLSLMIIDSSITERGEGPWLAGSHHSTKSVTLALPLHTHTHDLHHQFPFLDTYTPLIGLNHTGLALHLHRCNTSYGPTLP